MEGSGSVEYFGDHTVMPTTPYSQEDPATSCFQQVATLTKSGSTIQSKLYGSYAAAVVPSFAAEDHRFWGPSAEGEKLHAHLVWKMDQAPKMQDWFVKPSALTLLPQGIGGHFIASVD